MYQVKGYPDNNWFYKAQNRIDSIRKNNFTLHFSKLTNWQIGDSIKIELLSHEFEWGTATSFQPKNPWYYSTIIDYFNSIVIENDFKWPFMERRKGQVVYGLVQKYVDWAKENGIRNVRGHNLIWTYPRWIANYDVNKKINFHVTRSELERLIRTRITRDVKYYSGVIDEFDVINEPINRKELYSIFGDSIFYKCFHWAKKANPNSILFINEYNNIEQYGTYKYKSLILKLLRMNTPIDGIGLQCHILNERVNWKKIHYKLEELAKIGKPIKITEFDLKYEDSTQNRLHYENDIISMMKIAFSTPSVKGFYFWGFWDAAHWRSSALFHRDTSPKPVANTIYDLIHNKWSTKLTTTISNDLSVTFNGYYGIYRITNLSDKKTKTVECEFTKGGKLTYIQQ